VHLDVAPPAPATRALLVVASVLLLIAGGPLVGVPAHTDEWFAWTMPSPLTAMLLGGLLIALAVTLLFGAVTDRWVDSRVVVPPLLTTAALALVASLVEADSLHEDWTWTAWVALHAVIVVLGAAAYIAQWFEEGSEARREDGPAPGFSALVALEAAALLALGLVLTIDPERGMALWPWTISAIDSRTLGAVIVALGAAAASATFEGEPKRLRPFAVLDIGAAVAVAAAYLRDLDGLDWGRPMTAIIAVMAGLLAATGVWELRALRAPGGTKTKRKAQPGEHMLKRQARAGLKKEVFGLFK
jgi:hypothetical protein